MSDAERPAERLPFLRLVRYSLEAAAFFLFIGFFKILGIDAASAVGGFIGREIFYRTGVMKRARENLRAAYPEKSAPEIEAILLEMCDNLGRTVSEYAHLGKIGVGGDNPRVEAHEFERVLRSLPRDRGVMFFSGHFGNWEVMPFIAVQLGYEGGEVYRPQNNPFVDRWLVRQRLTYGPKDQIAKGPRGTRKIFTLLRGAKSICLLVDQKTNEGVPSVFFGREAMTTPAPAALALKVNALLVAAQIERTKGARFRVRLHQPLQFTPSGDHDKDILDLTQAITAKIEEIVRDRPSQWLWIYRRWPTARDQDQIRGKRAVQRGGDGVRVEREGSSLT